MSSPPRLLSTILLVERDERLRHAITHQLAQLGHRVLNASDARGAQVAWEHAARNVDLLLTRVLLPGMGGPVLAHRLRARAPGLMVIYLSDYRGEVLIAQGVLHPDAICLPLSYPPEMLASFVHRALVPPEPIAQTA